MVGCGTVGLFHVGGAVGSLTADSSDTQRWEFFVGDQPHGTAVDSSGRRQPFVQIREAAEVAAPREAVLSAEAAALVAAACRLTPTGPCFRLDEALQAGLLPITSTVQHLRRLPRNFNEPFLQLARNHER